MPRKKLTRLDDPIDRASNRSLLNIIQEELSYVETDEKTTPCKPRTPVNLLSKTTSHSRIFLFPNVNEKSSAPEALTTEMNTTSCDPLNAAIQETSQGSSSVQEKLLVLLQLISQTNYQKDPNVIAIINDLYGQIMNGSVGSANLGVLATLPTMDRPTASSIKVQASPAGHTFEPVKIPPLNSTVTTMDRSTAGSTQAEQNVGTIKPSQVPHALEPVKIFENISQALEQVKISTIPPTVTFTDSPAAGSTLTLQNFGNIGSLGNLLAFLQSLTLQMTTKVSTSEMSSVSLQSTQLASIPRKTSILSSTTPETTSPLIDSTKVVPTPQSMEPTDNWLALLQLISHCKFFKDYIANNTLMDPRQSLATLTPPLAEKNTKLGALLEKLIHRNNLEAIHPGINFDSRKIAPLTTTKSNFIPFIPPVLILEDFRRKSLGPSYKSLRTPSLEFHKIKTQDYMDLSDFTPAKLDISSPMSFKYRCHNCRQLEPERLKNFHIPNLFTKMKSGVQDDELEGINGGVGVGNNNSQFLPSNGSYNWHSIPPNCAKEFYDANTTTTKLPVEIETKPPLRNVYGLQSIPPNCTDKENNSTQLPLESDNKTVTAKFTKLPLASINKTMVTRPIPNVTTSPTQVNNVTKLPNRFLSKVFRKTETTSAPFLTSTGHILNRTKTESTIDHELTVTDAPEPSNTQPPTTTTSLSIFKKMKAKITKTSATPPIVQTESLIPNRTSLVSGKSSGVTNPGNSFNNSSIVPDPKPVTPASYRTKVSADALTKSQETERYTTDLSLTEPKSSSTRTMIKDILWSLTTHATTSTTSVVETSKPYPTSLLSSETETQSITETSTVSSSETTVPISVTETSPSTSFPTLTVSAGNLAPTLPATNAESSNLTNPETSLSVPVSETTPSTNFSIFNASSIPLSPLWNHTTYATSLTTSVVETSTPYATSVLSSETKTQSISETSTVSKSETTDPISVTETTPSTSFSTFTASAGNLAQTLLGTNAESSNLTKPDTSLSVPVSETSPSTNFSTFNASSSSLTTVASSVTSISSKSIGTFAHSTETAARVTATATYGTTETSVRPTIVRPPSVLSSKVTVTQKPKTTLAAPIETTASVRTTAPYGIIETSISPTRSSLPSVISSNVTVTQTTLTAPIETTYSFQSTLPKTHKNGSIAHVLHALKNPFKHKNSSQPTESSLNHTTTPSLKNFTTISFIDKMVLDPLRNFNKTKITSELFKPKNLTTESPLNLTNPSSKTTSLEIKSTTFPTTPTTTRHKVRANSTTIAESLKKSLGSMKRANETVEQMQKEKFDESKMVSTPLIPVNTTIKEREETFDPLMIINTLMMNAVQRKNQTLATLEIESENGTTLIAFSKKLSTLADFTETPVFTTTLQVSTDFS